MLPRTCIILLSLSLLSAAATLGDGSSSVAGAGKSPSAKAVGSVAGQKRRAAAKKPPGKAQGQGSRRPARRPAGRRPSRRPQRRPANQIPQIPDNAQDMNSNQLPAAADPRQTQQYVICYLYPAGAPMYQDVGRSQPFFGTSNGAMYPPYASYKSSLPANARKRKSEVKENKMFGPQMSYPYPIYPLRLECPSYQPVSAETVVSRPTVYGSDDNDYDYLVDTDDPDIAVGDVDPETFSLPDDGEIPLPYKSAYGSPERVPQSTYSSGAYVTPQAFRYPPPFPFRTNP